MMEKDLEVLIIERNLNLVRRFALLYLGKSNDCWIYSPGKFVLGVFKDKGRGFTLDVRDIQYADSKENLEDLQHKIEDGIFKVNQLYKCSEDTLNDYIEQAKEYKIIKEEFSNVKKKLSNSREKISGLNKLL